MRFCALTGLGMLQWSGELGTPQLSIDSCSTVGLRLVACEWKDDVHVWLVHTGIHVHVVSPLSIQLHMPTVPSAFPPLVLPHHSPHSQ